MKKENFNRIKFNNKAIDKIKGEDLDYSYTNKAGEKKFRKRLYFPFEVPKKSSLKGLNSIALLQLASASFNLPSPFNALPKL